MDGTNQTDFQNTFERMKQLLRTEDSFDVLYWKFLVGGREAAYFFLNGFVKDDIIQKITSSFVSIKEEDMPQDANKFSEKYLSYLQVEMNKEEDTIVKNVLSGVVAMFIEGYPEAYLIDCRDYPARGVEEPEKDRVMRGSRDGFVETVVFNTALIRRRIRSTELTNEMYTVGRASKTDIAVCYMRDRVDQQFLKDLIRRINEIDIDALTMNQESLAECLYKRGWWNPFPKYKYTERPDTAAASILEGGIAILVDNSPSAMILPCSVFDILEEADDYYFPPVTGTYLRLARFMITLLTWILTPTWLLLMRNPEWVPEWLAFIFPAEEIQVPLIWQLIILEFAIDGLRLAAVNTPNMLSTPLSVIAGLVLGDYAVQSGWFNSEAMLYMAFVVLANYSQPSFELGFALKFMRLITLLLTQIFNVWGYIFGVLFTIFCVCQNRTLSGKSYLYPLFPFNGREFLRRFVRISLPKTENK